MKTLQLSKVLICITTLLMINGCKKGKDGEPGKDGSSNVTARTFAVTSWSSNSARYFTQLSVPEITADNINSASVQAYFSKTSNSWTAMPITVVNTTNYFWGFVTNVNFVEIQWDYNSLVSIGSDPNTFYSATVQIKIVVIPPTARKAGVNHNNYLEVKKAYNLKDQI